MFWFSVHYSVWRVLESISEVELFGKPEIRSRKWTNIEAAGDILLQTYVLELLTAGSDFSGEKTNFSCCGTQSFPGSIVPVIKRRFTARDAFGNQWNDLLIVDTLLEKLKAYFRNTNEKNQEQRKNSSDPVHEYVKLPDPVHEYVKLRWTARHMYTRYLQMQPDAKKPSK